MIGQRKPFILIHGDGSTVQTTFGKVIPMLAKRYKIIAMDLQSHGRTSGRNAPESFEQDADDVVTFLKNLNISNADFFGFNNAGKTAYITQQNGLLQEAHLLSPISKKETLHIFYFFNNFYF